MLSCKDHQLSSSFAVPGLLGSLRRTEEPAGFAKIGTFNIGAPSLSPRLPFTVEDQLMKIQRKVDAIFHCTITTTLYIVIKSLFPLPILRYVTGVIPFPSCKSFHGQGVNLRRLLQM